MHATFLYRAFSSRLLTTSDYIHGRDISLNIKLLGENKTLDEKDMVSDSTPRQIITTHKDFQLFFSLLPNQWLDMLTEQPCNVKTEGLADCSSKVSGMQIKQREEENTGRDDR